MIDDIEGEVSIRFVITKGTEGTKASIIWILNMLLKVVYEQRFLITPECVNIYNMKF